MIISSKTAKTDIHFLIMPYIHFIFISLECILVSILFRDTECTLAAWHMNVCRDSGDTCTRSNDYYCLYLARIYITYAILWKPILGNTLQIFVLGLAHLGEMYNGWVDNRDVSILACYLLVLFIITLVSLKKLLSFIRAVSMEKNTVVQEKLYIAL